MSIEQESSDSFSRTVVFNRTERLVGETAMSALARARVIIFGVGGVGSWTAEALARTGVGHLTIVDADRVSPTNINRQAEANVATVGEVKVDAMKRQLLAVAPGIEVTALEKEYTSQTAADFDLEEFDFVIDAIDSLAAKALLLCNATAVRHPVVLSSMGAALKIDPTKISVAEFWKVQGCPLAASLRRKFKKSGEFPKRKFKCVYSPELLTNQGGALEEDMAMSFNKVAVNGSLCHITAIFGMTLAGLVVEQIVKAAKE